MNEQALAGVRVLDLSSIIAAPVTATMLGDFGAEVVKVEEPGRGDFMRRSAVQPGGRSLQWVQDARNKKSVTLNLREAAGREVLHRLLPHFDVVVTNFRPPTLERWGLGPDELHARYPRLVVLYITGYGMTGPYRQRGAFDRVASAFSGLTYVTGEAGRPSVRSGFAVIDYMTAYMGAFSVVTALYHRDRQAGTGLVGGTGQVIDLALYEPGFRASEEALLSYAMHGRVRERTGNINRNVVPAANFTAADGREVVIHAGTDPLVRRLSQIMGQPDLAEDVRFSTYAARVENQDVLYEIIGAWAGMHPADRLIELLVAADIPASPVMNIADIAADPHYRERGTIAAVHDDEFGDLLMAGPIPKMSRTPGSIRSLGPVLGAHNGEIYGDLLGMKRAELDALHASGVI